MPPEKDSQALPGTGQCSNPLKTAGIVRDPDPSRHGAVAPAGRASDGDI